MASIDLKQEQKSLNERIAKLELQLNPIQKQLQQARERLMHVEALLGHTSQPASVGRGYWKKLCRQHGWDVGGDSAHRVAKRRDPQLHKSIPHICEIAGRTYP